MCFGLKLGEIHVSAGTQGEGPFKFGRFVKCSAIFVLRLICILFGDILKLPFTADMEKCLLFKPTSSVNKKINKHVQLMQCIWEMALFKVQRSTINEHAHTTSHGEILK